jgi:hypothetical protein
MTCVVEGAARELVRRLQMMRRAADFEISDHIHGVLQRQP